MSGDRSDQSGKSGPRAAGPDRKLAEDLTPPGRRRQRAAPADLGGLDALVGYVVRRAQLWMVQDFRRALKGLGITPAQFSVLRVIAANPGISQVRVAEALAIERARLVQMIDSLEAAGHVERTRSVVDRRSHALRLTEGGRGADRADAGAAGGARAQHRGTDRRQGEGGAPAYPGAVLGLS